MRSLKIHTSMDCWTRTKTQSAVRAWQSTQEVSQTASKQRAICRVRCPIFCCLSAAAVEMQCPPCRTKTILPFGKRCRLVSGWRAAQSPACCFCPVLTGACSSIREAGASHEMLAGDPMDGASNTSTEAKDRSGLEGRSLCSISAGRIQETMAGRANSQAGGLAGLLLMGDGRWDQLALRRLSRRLTTKPPPASPCPGPAASEHCSEPRASVSLYPYWKWASRPYHSFINTTCYCQMVLLPSHLRIKTDRGHTRLHKRPLTRERFLASPHSRYIVH